MFSGALKPAPELKTAKMADIIQKRANGVKDTTRTVVKCLLLPNRLSRPYIAHNAPRIAQPVFCHDVDLHIARRRNH